MIPVLSLVLYGQKETAPFAADAPLDHCYYYLSFYCHYLMILFAREMKHRWSFGIALQTPLQEPGGGQYMYGKVKWVASE